MKKMPTKGAGYVKSAWTTTTVGRSRAEIMDAIERYGGTGFGYERRGDVLLVRFTVFGADGQPLTVAWPIDIAHVHRRLTEVMTPTLRQHKKGPPTMEQAEMVAWRNAYELIDAAFAAASIGAASVEQAFHAHMVVRSDDGSTGRLEDYVAVIRSPDGVLPAAGRVRGLLSSGSDR